MNVRIDHIALRTRDIETSRAFYETYFGGRAGPKYVNPAMEQQIEHLELMLRFAYRVLG